MIAGRHSLGRVPLPEGRLRVRGVSPGGVILPAATLESQPSIIQARSFPTTSSGEFPGRWAPGRYETFSGNIPGEHSMSGEERLALEYFPASDEGIEEYDRYRATYKEYRWRTIEMHSAFVDPELDWRIVLGLEDGVYTHRSVQYVGRLLVPGEEGYNRGYGNWRITQRAGGAPAKLYILWSESPPHKYFGEIGHPELGEPNTEKINPGFSPVPSGEVIGPFKIDIPWYGGGLDNPIYRGKGNYTPQPGDLLYVTSKTEREFKENFVAELSALPPGEQVKAMEELAKKTGEERLAIELETTEPYLEEKAEAKRIEEWEHEHIGAPPLPWKPPYAPPPETRTELVRFNLLIAEKYGGGIPGGKADLSKLAFPWFHNEKQLAIRWKFRHIPGFIGELPSHGYLTFLWEYQPGDESVGGGRGGSPVVNGGLELQRLGGGTNLSPGSNKTGPAVVGRVVLG